MFVHCSMIAVFVLYPYLTIHMRELGINVEEAAVMSALTPCIAVLMPPIAGIIADRIGNFKVLLSIFSGIGGLVALLLMFVPVGRVIIPFPDQIVFSMDCSNETDGYFRFTIAEGETCLQSPSSVVNEGSLEAPTVQPPLDYTNITVTLNSCGLICSHKEKHLKHQENNYESIIWKIRNSTKYVIHFEDDVSLDGYTYQPRKKDLVTPWHMYNTDINDARSLRKKKQIKDFQDSIQAFSNDKYYFPAPNLFDFSCDFFARKTVNKCAIQKYTPLNVNKFHYKRFMFTRLTPVYNVNNSNEIKGFSYGKSDNGYTELYDTTPNCHREIWNTSVLLSYPTMSSKGAEETLKLENCQPQCIMTAVRRHVCKNRFRVLEFDAESTFKWYLLIRLFIGVVSGTAFAMFEGAVIAILREKDADYGLQRIYASIGGMISSPLSGFLIDYNSRGKGYTDFRSAFYFYALLKIVTSFLMLQIDIEFKAPAKNVIRDVIEVLKKIEIIALYFSSFVLGTAWGYIESFLFWLLQDLGATRSLMGITITIGGIAGIPLLVMSGLIINRIGHANVLFIGFIFYAIRLLGYSLITSPWQCLIFEAMESITSSLAFTAAVTYAAKLSSTTTDSSIQGLLGGIYFGVGKGAGSLAGGYLIKYVGSRNTYRIFSVVILAIGFCYFLFNKYYISKHPSVQSKENVEGIHMSDVKSKSPIVYEISKNCYNGSVLQQNDVSIQDISDGRTNVGFESSNPDNDSTDHLEDVVCIIENHCYSDQHIGGNSDTKSIDQKIEDIIEDTIDRR